MKKKHILDTKMVAKDKYNENGQKNKFSFSTNKWLEKKLKTKKN